MTDSNWEAEAPQPAAPEDRTHAAAWRFGWTMALGIVAAGLTAVITDPNSVNTFLTDGPTPIFWRTAIVLFITGALMAAKKYYDIKL